MSEYLDEEEQLARLKSWWDENGTSILLAVGIALVGIVGLNWYGGYSDEQAQASTAIYADFLGADEAERTQYLEQLESEYPGSAAHILALFSQAAQASSEGDVQQAQTLLTRAVNEADDALMRDLAQLRLAKVERELGLVDEALNRLASVNNAGYKPLVLELQGDIEASRGNLEAAHKSYQAAVDSLSPGEQRPLLEMKLNNVQPFNSSYVELTDDLTEALNQATSTLDAAAQSAAQAAEAAADAAEDTAETVETAVEEVAEEAAAEAEQAADAVQDATDSDD